MADLLQADDYLWLKNVFFYLAEQANPADNNWTTDDFNRNANEIMSVDSKKADINTVWNAVMTIYGEIEQQQLSDDPVDNAIKVLADAVMVYSGRTKNWRTFDKLQIALILGRFCIDNGIEWDYSGFTDQEVSYFKKSLLGRGLEQAKEEKEEEEAAEAEQQQPAPQPAPQATSQPTTTQPA